MKLLDESSETTTRDGSQDLVTVTELAVSIASSRGTVHAVRGVSFSVRVGEVVGLVGESGSGKSVTARSILGLTSRLPGHRVSGSVTYNGKNLLTASMKELLAIRGREIAMVFQDPANHLDPSFTAGHAISEALQVHGVMDRGQARLEAERLLRMLKVPAPSTVANAYPHQLSGGMSQRVLIATAIACQPRLLIADEATSGLDATVQASILRTIGEMRDRLGMSVLMTTHNVRVVEKMCTRTLVMYAGGLVEAGPTPSVALKPLHPYTEALLACVPSAEDIGKPLASIPGEAPLPTTTFVGCPFAARCPRVREICRTAAPALREVEPGHWSACHFAEELAGGKHAPLG